MARDHDHTPAWRATELRVLLALIGGLLGVMLASCFDRPDPAPITPPPASKPVLAAPLSAAEQNAAELAAARGRVAELEAQGRELRLAPLRTSLRWAEGLSALGCVACVGLAVAAAFWGLGFAWKIPAGLALGFGGVLVACLGVSSVLDHLGWVLAALAALIAVGVVWLLRSHLSVAGAARELWDHVPPDAATSARVDALLARMTGKR